MVFLSSVKKLGNIVKTENHLDCCHLCSDRRIGLKCSNEKKKSVYNDQQHSSLLL